MNLRLVREFAALVSAHSGCVIEASEPIAESALWSFWEQARKQAGRWSSFLEKSAAEMSVLTESARKETWQHAEPILAEVFGLEMLTRVWATVLVASDVRNKVRHAAPVAHSAMSAQRHLRHLSLSLMVNCSHGTEPRLAAVDRYRRRVERWTDVLIGHLATKYGVADFAFDRKRTLEIGRDQLEGESPEPNSTFWRLIHSGMLISFPDATTPRTADPRRLGEFVQSVIAGLPVHLCRPGKPFATYVENSRPEQPAADRQEPDESPSILPLTRALREPSVGLSFTEIRKLRP